MADDPITVCEVCGEPVERVFYPVAVHFKGSGFYATDYGRARGGGGGDSGSKRLQGRFQGFRLEGNRHLEDGQLVGSSSSSGSSDSSARPSSSSDSGSSAKSD